MHDYGFLAALNGLPLLPKFEKMNERRMLCWSFIFHFSLIKVDKSTPNRFYSYRSG